MSKMGEFFKMLLIGLLWILRFVIGTVVLIGVLIIYVLIKLLILLFKGLCQLTFKLFPYYLPIMEKLR